VLESNVLLEQESNVLLVHDDVYDDVLLAHDDRGDDDDRGDVYDDDRGDVCGDDDRGDDVYDDDV
jgi:hypothetical protein